MTARAVVGTRAILCACALAVLALDPGCGARHTPQAPAVALPPQVIAVFPPPRATGVLYDIPLLWAQFATPLDSSTVSARTVYLKLDDVRLPVAVRYDAATRRILVTPLVPLALRSVYTVEISPRVATTDGQTLVQTWFWQFTTNSLQRPKLPLPVSGTTGESPFVTLLWAGGSPDGTRYVIYAGTDSARVAARADSSLGTSVGLSRWLPRTRWTEGGRTWWSVRATNLVTGEQIDGPVWHFDALGPGLTPVDSVALGPSEWGWQLSTSNRSCFGAELVTSQLNVLRFGQTPLLGTSVRLAGMRLVLASSPTSPVVVDHDVSVYGLAGTYPPCGTLWNTVPPTADGAFGALASNERGPGNLQFIESDGFTAHYEDVQRRGYLGYVLVARPQYRFIMQNGSPNGPAPQLIVRYYVPGAAPRVSGR